MHLNAMKDGAISGFSTPRSVVLTVGLAIAGLFLSGCASSPVLPSAPAGAASETVLPSDRYSVNVTPALQAERLRQIGQVVTVLRQRSSGGWQARQDDVTGFAGELSGGRWTGAAEPLPAARDFLTNYGAAFGLANLSHLTFPPSAGYDAAGESVLRLTQVYEGIPVDGGSLLIPVARRGSAAEISYVRGRIADVSNVPTKPVVSAAAAAATVQRAAGAPASRPSLIIVTTGGTTRLAWQVDVVVIKGGESPTGGPRVADGPSRVFVDATSGSILESRPLSTDPAPFAPGAPRDLGKYDFDLPPAGRPVKVTGKLPDGSTATVNAEQQPDGSVAFVDATGPGANRQTKKGIIVIFDGTGLTETSKGSVGKVFSSPSTTITNTDALMAMFSARHVLDYYRTEFLRLSFDGRNSPMLITINYTGGEKCYDNAFFATQPGQSRMGIGVPCVEDGKPSARTFADLSIVGHEVTHGVTHTTAAEFGYSVQQTAIDEGTSDYFGYVIENRVTGRYRTSGMWYGCQGVANERFCRPQTAGQRGLRDVNTGATYDDLIFSLSDPFGFASRAQDDGHANSRVWSNALWKARTALVRRDGGDPFKSPRARAFDRAVHKATTTYLDASSDLIQAAEAVQRVVAETRGLDRSDRDRIRRQFQQSKLCRGCNLPRRINRHVSASSDVKVRPQVTNRGVVFNRYESRLRSAALIGTAGSKQLRALGTADALTVRVTGHGNAVASTVLRLVGEDGETFLNLRDLATGRVETVSTSVLPWVAPAMDDTTLAWVDVDESGKRAILRVRPLAGGTPRSIDAPKTPAHLAVSGQRLVVYYSDGELVVYDLVSGNPTRLATLGKTSVKQAPVPAGGIAIDGDRLAVLADPLGGAAFLRGQLLVFDLRSGTAVRVSTGASPFGVAMADGVLIWAEVIGVLGGKVAQYSPRKFPDTELRAFSFRTNKFYRVAGQRGQQGFPSFDGKTLAWQDTVGGGDDIFATPIPKGL